MSASSSRIISRFAILGVTAMMVLTTSPLTNATNIAAPTPLPTIVIGTNVPLAPSAINFAQEFTCSSSAGVVKSCQAVVPGVRDANSSITITDKSQTQTSAEQFVAYAFNLVRACNGQSTLKPMTVNFTFGYGINPNVPLLVQGAASGVINARAHVGDLGSPVKTAGSASSTTAQLASVVLANNTTYQIGLGAQTVAQMTDTPVPGESVSSFTNVTLGSIQLDFHDLTAPAFNYTHLDPPAQLESGNFLGYVSASSVQIRAQAWDPPKVGNLDVGQSCVSSVDFSNGGGTRSVDYFQSEVESDSYSGEGLHSVTATAHDYQGNPGSASLTFIIDSVAPTPGISLYPLNENGKNGWYMAPGPKYNLTCNADPNGIGTANVAPCKEIKLSDDGGAHYRTVSDATHQTFVQVATQTGSDSVQGYAYAVDDANNAATAVSTRQIKVDIQPPRTNISTNQTPKLGEFGNGWFRSSTSMDFQCLGDDTSGCGDLFTTTDGSSWTNTTHFACTTEQDSTIHYDIEDVAGNAVNTTQHFGCDFTAPTDIGDNVDILNAVYNNNTHVLYTNSSPSWSWPAQSDPVSNGVSSGLRMYEIFVNDEFSPRNVTAPTHSFSPSDLLDGQNCIQVRTVDNAGNRGALTPLSCVFVDRKAPTIGYNLPNKGKLYFEGQAISVSFNNSATTTMDAIVVGPILTGATTTDVPRNPAEDSSLVDNVELILTKATVSNPLVNHDYWAPASFGAITTDEREDGQNLDHVPCDHVNVYARTCSWNDTDEAGNIGADPQARLMYVRAWDNAQNRNIIFRNYTRVEVGAVEQACSLTPECTRIFMDASAPAGTILSLAVWRGTTPDFGPSLTQGGTLIGTTTQAGNHYVDDTSAQKNNAYYYKVVATGASTSLVSKAVKLYLTGKAGNVGDW